MKLPVPAALISGVTAQISRNKNERPSNSGLLCLVRKAMKDKSFQITTHVDPLQLYERTLFHTTAGGIVNYLCLM